MPIIIKQKIPNKVVKLPINIGAILGNTMRKIIKISIIITGINKDNFFTYNRIILKGRGGSIIFSPCILIVLTGFVARMGS